MTQELDLTPAPRVLQMLGEINLEQWRCLAELIDNSIDGFIDAARAGAPIVQPEIAVSIPTADTENARVSVKDNGPGMSLETLENALRAGWSGNDPLSKLGLFGMGFNIATARLGIELKVLSPLTVGNSGVDRYRPRETPRSGATDLDCSVRPRSLAALWLD